MSATSLSTLKPSEEAILLQRGYKIMKKLGEGSYAKVYLSEYTSSKNSDKKYNLACKIVDANRAPPYVVQKFLPRELDVLVKLNHPHLVHTHSIFQRRSKYFIFMRYAEKGDVYDLLMEKGPFKEQQVRIWIKQLTLALEYLHLQEIVHRDIKCENVLITANNNVLLADFGFARYVVNKEGHQVCSRTFCGSMAYAAPELVRALSYNPKMSDMWSLGVLLYAMLCQSFPFETDNPAEMVRRQMEQEWDFRPKIKALLSQECKDVVAGLMLPEPKDRHTCDSLWESEWFAADPRGNKLSEQELHARASAIRMAAEIHSGKRPPNSIKVRPRRPLLVKKQKAGTSKPTASLRVLKEVPAKTAPSIQSRYIAG